MNRKEIENLMEDGEYFITFNKVDGTLREIRRN